MECETGSKTVRQKTYVANEVEGQELPLELVLYFRAYIVLLSECNYEAGVIPFTSMIAYANHYNFSKTQTELLVEILIGLNTWMQSKQSKKGQSGGTSGDGSTGEPAGNLRGKRTARKG